MWVLETKHGPSARGAIQKALRLMLLKNRTKGLLPKECWVMSAELTFQGARAGPWPNAALQEDLMP